MNTLTMRPATPHIDRTVRAASPRADLPYAPTDQLEPREPSALDFALTQVRRDFPAATAKPLKVLPDADFSAALGQDAYYGARPHLLQKGFRAPPKSLWRKLTDKILSLWRKLRGLKRAPEGARPQVKPPSIAYLPSRGAIVVRASEQAALKREDFVVPLFMAAMQATHPAYMNSINGPTQATHGSGRRARAAAAAQTERAWTRMAWLEAIGIVLTRRACGVTRDPEQASSCGLSEDWIRMAAMVVNRGKLDKALQQPYLVEALTYTFTKSPVQVPYGQTTEMTYKILEFYCYQCAHQLGLMLDFENDVMIREAWRGRHTEPLPRGDEPSAKRALRALPELTYAHTSPQNLAVCVQWAMQQSCSPEDTAAAFAVAVFDDPHLGAVNLALATGSRS